MHTRISPEILPIGSGQCNDNKVRLKLVTLPLLWDSARSIRRDSRFIDSQTFQIVVPMLFQLSTHSRHWDKIRIWTHGWKSALLRDGDLGIFTTHWKIFNAPLKGGLLSPIIADISRLSRDWKACRTRWDRNLRCGRGIKKLLKKRLLA